MLGTLRSDVLGEGACIDTPFGRRRITYADHIASGRPLGSVEETLRRCVLPLYANTHTEDSATGARTSRLMTEAAAYVKRCLGGDDTYKILFPGTGTTGAIKRLQEILGVSVPGRHRERLLAALPRSERLVVFVGPYEHHSNEVTWRESLAEVVAIPLADDGRLDLAALEAALQDDRYAGRPKLGSFSAASNVTGLLTDVRAVAELLHRHGARAVFDFAASGPYVDIDVRPGRADGIDAVALSPHKFLGGPGSPGVLLFHESLYDLTSPTCAGGGTVRYVSRDGHRFLDDVEAREDAGTPGIAGRIRAALAFRVKEDVGVPVIEARERDLVTRALDELAVHPSIELLGNVEAPRLAVASFLVRSQEGVLHPRFVVRLLNDLFGIQARAGCSCAGPYGHALLGIDGPTSAAYLRASEAGFDGVKPGWSRVSFHYLTSEAEFRFLLDAIRFVADRGHRFVPLYEFDWHSGAWRHPADDAGPSTFEPEDWSDVPRTSEPAAEAYRRYLAKAHAASDRLRRDRPPVARRAAAEIPDGVDPSLISFSR